MSPSTPNNRYPQAGNRYILLWCVSTRYITSNEVVRHRLSCPWLHQKALNLNFRLKTLRISSDQALLPDNTISRLRSFSHANVSNSLIIAKNSVEHHSSEAFPVYNTFWKSPPKHDIQYSGAAPPGCEVITDSKKYFSDFSGCCYVQGTVQ